MKKILIALIVFTALGAGGYLGWRKWHSPSTIAIESAAQPADTSVQYYRCGMHPWITSDKPGKCPLCGMELLPVYKKSAEKKDGMVSISPQMEQDIGVRTQAVVKRKLIHTIRTSGIVEYDEEKQTIITTKFSGWIEKLYVNYTGEQVEKGQPLFDVYSPDLVAAQQEYLQAIGYGQKMNEAGDSSVSAGASQLVQSAKRKLRYWDISAQQVSDLEKTGEIKKTLTIFSPFSGVVTEKDVFEGMQVEQGMNLLRLSDMSTMWVDADIYEGDLPFLKIGDSAEIALPYSPSANLYGKVTYIYPYLQDQTRTVRARIEIANKGNLLKKDMYVSLDISQQTTRSALTVPEQSVIHSGLRNIVILSLGNGSFQPVDVRLGVLSGNYYEVLDGLKAGDTIVTSSQFLLDSESNLEAGLSQMGNMPGMNMNSMGKKEEKPSGKMSDTSMKGMKM